MRQKFILLFLTLIFFSAISIAQNQPRTAPEFLLVNNNARSLALGEATVALLDESGASHLNPATIGMNGVIQGSTNISWLKNDRLRLRRFRGFQGVWSSMTAVSYKEHKYAYEVSFLSNNRIDEPPDFFSDFKEQVFNASFAFNILHNMWIGGGINYIYSRREDLFNPEDEDIVTAKNFSLDFGIHHQLRKRFEKFSLYSSLAWSLTDFGPTFSFSESQEINNQKIRYGLPMRMRAGMTVSLSTNSKWANRPYATVRLLGSLSKEMARTDNGGDPHGPFRTLFSSWGSYRRGDAQKLRIGDQIQRHQGIELSFLDVFHGRIGYINRPSKRYSSDLASFGLGINLFYARVDYTRISLQPEVDDSFFKETSIWQITGRIPLNKANKRNFWPNLFKLF